MSLSIKDIARKAGVSTATVSRVINNSALVQSSTRKRVQHIIDKLNFQPNMSAQNLIKGRTDLLTLIVPPEPNFFTVYYFREILCGISEALSKRHYRLIIYQTEGYDQELGYPSNFGGFSMNGIFLIAPIINDRLVKKLEKAKYPTVLINARSTELDWVDLDNVQSSLKVVEKLAGLGHRRIGFIGGISKGFNTIARLEGYYQALKKLQLPFDADLIVSGDYTAQSGYELAKKLLALKRPPTAIFATNDSMAIGAVKAVTESGLSVPEDISVFGFDDMDIAILSAPALSTVRQPFCEMGKTAGEILMNRVEHPENPQKCAEFSGEIIMRQSCVRLENRGAGVISVAN